jgi:poly(hydroxyalkanoate) depolymerase family esterase
MRYSKRMLRAAFALQRSLLRAAAPPARRPQRRARGSALIEAGRFVEHTYRNGAGSRSYKVYAPAAAPPGRLPLVMMLHGCLQDPDDFASATRMNELADELGFVVAYPAQPSRANSARCWNWFEALHQRRDEGEPSLIAGITRRLLRQGLDRHRVFVAGLSAGGAMAAVMGAEYGDLYAAVGIHSGPAPGGKSGASIPVIAFHGDGDATVHPSNSDFVRAPGSRVATERGEHNGRPFTRTVHRDARGRPSVERWIVHGAGHAWFGGRPGASFADPAGPDASREMLRFFLSQPPGRDAG